MPVQRRSLLCGCLHDGSGASFCGPGAAHDSLRGCEHGRADILRTVWALWRSGLQVAEDGKYPAVVGV